MTLGSLMAFLAYLAMFYAPLSTLSQLTTWLTSFMTGCQRVFELLDTPVETNDPAQPMHLPEARGEIRFENVTFGYDRHRPVLKDVDFTIRPGEKIGIVGRSGSGKTTLVNLISRFYDVDSGRVLLDGLDVRELATADLRRHVGVVLQEPFLFRGTICDNLVYGRPDASPKRRSPLPAPPRPTISSSARRWATTPGWANAAPDFPAARGNASPSRGLCSTIRGC